MKTKPVLAALSYLAISLPAFADTFTLKDGSTLDATVISETPENYLLNVQVTKSIKDERTVAKADVVKVSRERADLKAFEAISKLVPTPDFLTDEDYGRSAALIQKFIKENPTSLKVADAKAMLETLRTESSEVAVGGVKFNGKMITAAEYKTNAYELDARVQETKIRGLVESSQFLAALRLFSDFDRDFRTTTAYGTLSPVVKQVIQNHVAESKQLLATLPARLKERELGLQRMAPEDRTGTEAAIKEENVAIEARYKAEKDAKQKWVTPGPFNKASLEDTVKTGEAELVRLAAVKPALGVDGGKAYRELYTAVNTESPLAAVTAAATAAKTALVPVRYVAPLEAAAKGRK